MTSDELFCDERLIHVEAEAIKRLLKFMRLAPPRKRRDEYLGVYRRRLAEALRRAACSD